MEEPFINYFSSTSSPMPMPMPMPSLVSRVDRLDSLMKHLEGKKEKEASRRRWASCSEIGPAVPMEWAMMEAQLKGSISDRIASLEYRLVQLILQMESDEAEATSSASSQMEQNFPEITSSPTLSRKDALPLSFSRFRTFTRNSKKQSQQNCIVEKLEVSERKGADQEKAKKKEEFVEKTSRNVEERSSPKPKKINVPSRLNLRLLGC